MIVGEYTLEGHYIYRDRRGVQSGEVALCSDGKLVGRVCDNNFGVEGDHGKLFLGVRSPEYGTLSAVKISPGMGRKGRDLNVVFWHLHSDAPLRNGGREESYGGGWVFTENEFPLANQMEEALLTGGMPSFKSLSEFPMGLLKEYFFPPNAVEYCKEESARLKQTGGLVLTALD